MARAATDLAVQRRLVLDVLRAAAAARAAYPLVGPAVRDALRRLPGAEPEPTVGRGVAGRPAVVAAPATQACLDRLAEVAHTWPGGLVAHLSVWAGERTRAGSDPVFSAPVFSAEEQRRVVAERELARRLRAGVLGGELGDVRADARGEVVADGAAGRGGAELVA